MASFDRDKFHVVTMVSNPVRFESRYNLYFDFRAQMEAQQVNFWTVELQLGDRPFIVTDANNPKHLQLRIWDEVWHKENALNLGIAKLPADWETVAWIDADIEFVNKGKMIDGVIKGDWVEETLHQLQVYKVVQMFENSVDMSPTGGVMMVRKSFMSRYIESGATFPGSITYLNWHPGYAWAARREAINDMGGLLDRVILGSGDYHMALAFIGRGQDTFPKNLTSNFKTYIMDFQDRVEASIRRDVGFVNGSVIHFFHGKRVDRRYWDRWKILSDNSFEPYTDVKPDSYGVLQLHDDGSQRFLRLRDGIRAYFRGRNEDSIDVG